MTKNRQLYILKFKSGRLKKFGYDIQISFEEARITKELVPISDNQFLRSIRDIRGMEIDYNHLEEAVKLRNELKRKKNSKAHRNELNRLQDIIRDYLFHQDYITVEIEHLKHYEYIFHNGVIINGKVYKRLSCSAGQARVSTVVLCNTEIIDELKRRINNGRDMTIPLTPSKFNAYFGLAGSATHLVSEPKFVVVKDFLNYDKFMCNYVTETDWNVDDTVEQSEVVQEMNRTDGMGLISPAQSERWANELGLDYIPAEWCVRQSFLKGMLCTFPFHEFCKEVNGDNYIVKTIYKNVYDDYIEVDLRDYDIIITESMFKLWNCYSSVESYIENYRKNKLYWGVTQFTPKEPKDILNLNYQFIQTLNLKAHDIEKLANQFVEWINGVTFDNFAYTLIFLLGGSKSKEQIQRFINSSDNYWVKSLIINPELKKDPYIRDKVYDLVKGRIERACMGEISVNGNFQVIVSDPYAFMQHVCGLDVTGLLQKGEFYSHYWNMRGVTQVDAMRSPLTYRSEHVLLNLRNDETVKKWYRYCTQGIILNWHGHECVNFSGSDFDYDILATTDNPQMINGVYRDELPVVYTPPKAAKILFTEQDLYSADIFSFGSIIGSITNKSTIAYSLLPEIEENFGIDSEEYSLLISRLKQCCKAQSAQIDKAKIGREVKGIPGIWINRSEIYDDDTAEAAHDKTVLNNVLLGKYPYFFRYVYQSTKKKYLQYYNESNNICMQRFETGIADMSQLKRRTPEQNKFVEDFYKYSPVNHSESPMNMLCSYIEAINFNLRSKFRKEKNFELHTLYRRNEYGYDSRTYEMLKLTVETFLQNKQNEIVASDCESSDDKSVEYCIDNMLDTELEQQLCEISSNVYVIVNCLVDYFYIEKPSKSKTLLWSVYGKHICENVRRNTLEKIKYPILNKDGDIIYMNNHYAWEEV